MNPIFLLTCSKEKMTYSCAAEDLYCSKRFVDTKHFMKQQTYDWYILSAKYGLVKPNEILDPYDYNIVQKTTVELQIWVDSVVKSLNEIYEGPQTFVILADDSYSIAISSALKVQGHRVVLPYKDMSYEKQKIYIANAKNGVDNVKKLYNIIYDVAEKTRGIMLFKDSDGKKYWPQKGLYFILDLSESSFAAQKPYKIIRVGTHAVSKGSKSTLWHRLKTHKGLNNGGGAHRSSIFRLHVGNALIRKNGLNFPTWAIGQSASMEIREQELELEKQVSEYIGNLGIVVLEIDDPSSATSDRAFIEKNAIALLSSINYSLDFPSMNWLGHYSIKQEIRESSLWNVNYVNLDFNKDFFTCLENYAKITINKFNKGLFYE